VSGKLSDSWGIVGCAYMAKEYCKVLIARGIKPQVFSRNLTSANVESFQAMYSDIAVRPISDIGKDIGNWLVCTNIESHADVCARLDGNIYCEKPYAMTPDYDAGRDIIILMNRRYYYWVSHMREIIDSGRISKVIAVIPEKSIDALITQSIHVVDLLWYLVGPFQAAKKLGSSSPSYFLSTDRQIPLIINMNYGAHENFSIRFYAENGDVYEARPLEMFAVAEGMEVREPDDDIPLRSYTPIVRPYEYPATNYKPGLGELIDDLISGAETRLPDLTEHRQIHAWMQDNMV